MKENPHSLLENRRRVIGNIVFVALIIVAFPIGLIIMWLRYKTWPLLAKILLTFLPIYIFFSSLKLYEFFTTFESDWKYSILKEENNQLKLQH